MMKYVVYNMAHGHAAVMSKDGCAWIRILGFFDDLEEAMAHAAACSGREDAKIETRLWHLGPFKGMYDDNLSSMSAEALSACLESQNQRTAEKLHAWVKHRETQDAEVRTAANQKMMRDVTDVHVQAHFAEASQVSLDPPAGEKAAAISRTMEMRSQQFALLAVVPDVQATLQNADVQRSLFFQAQWSNLNACAALQGLPEHAEVHDIEALETFRKTVQSAGPADVIHGSLRKQEPLVAFLQVGDTVEELREAIKERWSLDTKYTHADLAIVNMYEWIKPETASQNLKVQRTYRNEQLGQFKDIMIKSLRNEMT